MSQPRKRQRKPVTPEIKLPEAKEDFFPLATALGAIDRAVGLLAPPGTPRFDRLMKGARCPLPPLGLANGLMRDALAVLEGNPYAVRSFVETVEQLNAGNLEMPNIPKDWAEKRDEKPHAHRQWTPEDRPSISPERSIPLLAAAAAIGGAGLYSINRLLGGVYRLLCQFEDFGNIHRLALDAGRSEAALARFGAALDWRFPECGPFPSGPDEGFPLPDRRNCLPWLDWHKECFNDVGPGVPSVPYTIQSVTPAVACPGDLISIAGSGFGTGGTVVFRRLGGGELEVAAQSWSDTLITVIVPATTGGGLWLKIPAGSRLVCGVLIPNNVPGQVFENFDGSAPYIEALHLGGSHVGPFTVRPGAPFAVHWRAYGATDRTLLVSNAQGGTVAQMNNLPAVGATSSLLAPQINIPERWHARLTATGGCQPGQDVRDIDIWISEDPALIASGIEVTQAIQYYRSAEHLTDANDRQADNAMTLVRNKAAWVRVYVKSLSTGMPDHRWPGITGELLVERIVSGNVAASFTLPSRSLPIGVRANDSYGDVRGNIDRTLNFVIPAAEATGRLRLTARSLQAGEPFSTTFGSVQTTVDFARDQRLQLAGILVAFDGPPRIPTPPGTPNLVIAAPTISDLDNSLGYTMATMPINEDVQTRNAGAVTLTVPLNDQPPTPGGCTPNWGTLMTLVTQARDADGNQAGWLYYGLLPNGVPMGPVIGCGGGVATGTLGDQITMAHEIGHLLGRPHAPCGNVGTFDTTYPAYEPYDTAAALMARIGEYGLDIRDGTLHPPSENDFMSYCGPRWVSLHNHNLYLAAAGLNATTVAVGQQGEGMAKSAAYSDMLTVLGRVDEDGKAHIQSVTRASLQSLQTAGQRTSIQLELLDAKGGKLAYGWLHASVPEASCAGCGGLGASAPGENPAGPYLFEARLPWREDGFELRLREGERVLWARRAYKRKPGLSLRRCAISKTGQLDLAWSVALDPEAVPAIWVQWAPAAEGKLDKETQWTYPWKGLAVGISGSDTHLSAAHLPAGRIAIRVVLHDGFSSVAVVRELDVPRFGPRVTIVHPCQGSQLVGSQGLSLWGRAFEAGGVAIPDDKLVWRLDGKIVGRGKSLHFRANEVKAGSHEASISVEGEGKAAQDRVKFTLSKNKD